MSFRENVSFSIGALPVTVCEALAVSATPKDAFSVPRPLRLVPP